MVVTAAASLWAGDTAVFVDLGFSPDGRTYMFGQYGVQPDTLRPWADLCAVDVSANDFVPGGRLSYVHESPVSAGQDGSGALFRLVSRNGAFAERCNVSFLLQGQPLYINMENGASPSGGESVEFRDFEKAARFQARLVSQTEGAGANAKSSFYINLDYQGPDGRTRNYVAGNSLIKRAGVSAYRIRKVMAAPRDGAIVFVIEMKKQNASGGVDIRYMVETLKL